MNNIANLTKQKRAELFSETATLMKTTNAIVEKDFWVVWTLDKIFSDDRLNKILMFKGGTSLSKVFNLIGRFSEDIDLILDWRLVSKENPLDEQESKNKQTRFNEQINENAKIYIKDILLPIISQNLSPLCSCNISEDEFSINVNYPNAFDDTYLRPEILLEIGPLASWLPSDSFEISSFAAIKFPQVFEKPTCNINTIVAKRTFWEKATILHHEANRPVDSTIPIRYSRHYYDLAMMAQNKVKDEALNDLDLLTNVVEFKQKFYPRNWAKYEEAKKGTFKLLPPKFRLDTLEKDYKAI
ncbi:nucleotidyl transferase AbiEii/AbiGii toxin family protein [Aliarcobacter lanthieri]|uniref:nucleotidyl transferase AbiEii/AbiGii toxin family protein n=1 Tax=Aliarcobacter lanthieri TaxID=1355374 RepID=UPI000AF45728|nr:nucleotidyl transferase AbiEii/AbiGii toxin family protein [Aliarcobacter lanthieri]QKF59085.1 nucleotidyltransferase, AbiEii toxin family [Aliarcobacter lanthieri]